MTISMIGLGKMGANMARRLLRGGHTVHVFDRDSERVAELEAVNALGHACLERTYSFRHRERFLLAGKLGVAVDVGRETDERLVRRHIESMFRSNMMAVVGSTRADGASQCYTCGYGEDCAVGNVVANHGYLERIEPHHLPPEFDAQPEALAAARKTGRVLGSMLHARQQSERRGDSAP